MIPCAPAVSACKWKYFKKKILLVWQYGKRHALQLVPSGAVPTTCSAFLGDVLVLPMELVSELAQFLQMLSDFFVSTVWV